MEVLCTTKVSFFYCNHLAKYNYSIFLQEKVGLHSKQTRDTPTQESSGSSTWPRLQLLTSRQAQDLLSTLLDGEISDNSVVEEPSTISDEEFDGSSLSRRSRSKASSSAWNERPLIPAKRSKPSTTKGTNRPRSKPRSTATESVVTGCSQSHH